MKNEKNILAQSRAEQSRAEQSRAEQSSRSAISSHKNYNSIDLVKFICSILVVMIHISPFGSFSGIIGYLDYGVRYYLCRLAVPFFFVCSGFFLYKKTAVMNFSFEPTKKYVVRLFRLYIIWTLIYFPLSYIRFYRGKKDAVFVYIKRFIFSGTYVHLWYLNATIFAILLFLNRYILTRKLL